MSSIAPVETKPAIEATPEIVETGVISKILVRLDEAYHLEVKRQANDEGVSINTYILNKLGFPVEDRRRVRKKGDDK